MKGMFYKEPDRRADYQAMLPKVGDKMIRKIDAGNTHGLGDAKAHEAVVTYVNKEHLWYMLRFPCGVQQAYRLV